MRILRWITGNIKKNGIQNEEIYLKDRETIDEKMRGSHLKWFGYVQRNVINILIDRSSKRTMSIKEVTKSMVLDKIKGQKRLHVYDLN